MIFIGRIIFGVTSGFLTSCAAKVVDEIVPIKMLGIYGASTAVFMSFGMFNSLILGLLLPDSEDHEA